VLPQTNRVRVVALWCGRAAGARAGLNTLALLLLLVSGVDLAAAASGLLLLFVLGGFTAVYSIPGVGLAASFISAIGGIFHRSKAAAVDKQPQDPNLDSSKRPSRVDQSIYPVKQTISCKGCFCSGMDCRSTCGMGYRASGVGVHLFRSFATH